ncbi:MAG TPA: glycosyltransferase, partial [Patescibacteria group bacterium]|nr:glycosyltransferase [Patescibacteria group bacterium]
MKHTDVAIIIVTYRFPRTKLSQLLSSLLRIGVKKGNIFIRDNTRDNIGYAGAINEIVKKQIQKYTYFLILNPDISFTENFIAPLLETVRQGKADIAGPVLYDETGKVWATTGIIDKKRFSAGLETKKLHHLTYVDYV